MTNKIGNTEKKLMPGKSLHQLHNIYKSISLVILSNQRAAKNLFLCLMLIFAGTHTAFAQSRCETSEVINYGIPNDSAEIEGEVHLNTATAPATLGKIVIKEAKKELYTDDKGYFKTRVKAGNTYKVTLMSVDRSGKKEKNVYVLDVKVSPKSQHRIRLKFYVDVSGK